MPSSLTLPFVSPFVATEATWEQVCQARADVAELARQRGEVTRRTQRLFVQLAGEIQQVAAHLHLDYPALAELMSRWGKPYSERVIRNALSGQANWTLVEALYEALQAYERGEIIL